MLNERDMVIVQKTDGSRRGFEAEVPTSAQDDEVASVPEQFGQVGRLDAGTMLGTGLPPIPRSAAAGPQLRVSHLPETFDLDGSPSVAAHSG